MADECEWIRGELLCTVGQEPQRHTANEPATGCGCFPKVTMKKKHTGEVEIEQHD